MEQTGARIEELERNGIESMRIAAMQAEVSSMARQVVDLKRQRDELHAASNRELDRRRAVEARPKEILKWAQATFGDVALDGQERAMRLLEESIEVAQAAGVQDWVATNLVSHVYGRPPGDLAKELGAVGLTAEAMAAAVGLDLAALTVEEWDRVRSIDVEKMRFKHAAKQAGGIARSNQPAASSFDHDLDWLVQLVGHKNYSALVLAGSAKALKIWTNAATVTFRALGALPCQSNFRFPSGAMIYTGYITNDKDYEQYRGHEYQNILMVNGQFSKPAVLLMKNCNRQTVEGVTPEFRIGFGAKVVS